MLFTYLYKLFYIDIKIFKYLQPLGIKNAYIIKSHNILYVHLNKCNFFRIPLLFILFIFALNSNLIL